MVNVNVNLSNVIGKVKPMHAVNNGPVGSRVREGASTDKYFEYERYRFRWNASILQAWRKY